MYIIFVDKRHRNRMETSALHDKDATTVHYYVVYTVSQKKVPTFKLCVTLSNFNRFSKFSHC